MSGGTAGRAIVLTAGDIAGAVGGRLRRGAPDRVVSGFSIDSRTIGPGELFIALRGDRFDGGAFVAASLAAGACGAMAAPGTTVEGDAIWIEVDDATQALQALGRHVRRLSGARVVAITGSAGKTSTKEAAAAFLEERYTVFRNRGNLNNHIGLPLSLLELRSRPDVAVVELGMNHAGEISRLVALAEPEIRVWTNVGEAHLGFFASPDAIADAKAEIFEGAGPATHLVANADDTRVMARVPRFAGRVTTFGFGGSADVRAVDVEDRGLEGSEARLVTPHGDVRIRVPLPGRAQLANVLAAAAVALALGVPPSAIAARAEALRPAPHRGEVVRLPRGVTLVDDSYNASPTAVRRALDVLASASAGRRVAVLGEMLELGAFTGALHAEIGAAAAAAGVDRLLAVGGDAAAALARSARGAGLGDAATHHASSEDAADVLLAELAPGDVVLVKGSRGIRTDAIVERVKAGWR